MSCKKELNINGEIYIKKETPTDRVVVRTYSAGVFIGTIVSRDGKEVVLKNARRVYRWSGAATLSQMAVDGVSNPEGCKMPCEVPEIILTEAIEIIPMTGKAIVSINEVPVWKA